MADIAMFIEFLSVFGGIPALTIRASGQKPTEIAG
jgi:hypothetical protein